MSRDPTTDSKPVVEEAAAAGETATLPRPAADRAPAAPESATEEVEAPTLPAAPSDGPPPSESEAEEPPEEADAHGEVAPHRRRRIIRIGMPILVLALIGGGYYVWTVLQRVKIDDSTISADTTVLSPSGGGKLKAVYASAGDQVEPHRPVAQVGNELISSDVPGTVISIRKDLGSYIPAGATVATLIKRGELRAIGHLKQDKGLSDIRIGQRANVEVYGYGTRKFPGYVEDISAQPQQQQLSFAISDKNEKPKYDVKIHFLGDPSPVLRQGMDAKIFVYKG